MNDAEKMMWGAILGHAALWLLVKVLALVAVAAIALAALVDLLP